MKATDPQKRLDILNAISNGYSQREAFQKAGVSESVFYRWLDEDREFREAVHNAQEEARRSKADIRGVERALLDLAKGFEYEDVKTEYESKEVINPDTGQKEYKPVIKKQVRVTKRVPANIEAIKFLLTNRDPDNWKNRVDQTQMGNLETNLTITYKGDPNYKFPSSEADLDLNREKQNGADNQGQ